MKRCKHYDFDCKKEEMTCEGCAYNKKSADIIFFELGYTKHIDGLGNIEFYKYTTLLCQDDTCNIIRFFIDSEEVGVNKILSMQELKAINKKVEELGWI